MVYSEPSNCLTEHAPLSMDWVGWPREIYLGTIKVAVLATINNDGGAYNICMIDTLRILALFSNLNKYAWHILAPVMALLQSHLRARRNRKANIRSSPLYSLPVEIIQHIGGYLDEVDRICFALSTSKYLEALCPAHLVADRQKGPSMQILHRLKRDHFYISRTYWLIRQLGHLWCVSCVSPHPRQEYPNQTTSLPPHRRTCFEALNGPLMICSHHPFKHRDFSRMKKIAKKHWVNSSYRSVSFECKDCCCIPKITCNCWTRRTYPIHVPVTRPLFFQPPTLFLERRTLKTTLRSTSYLMGRDTRGPLTADKLRVALPKARLEICPHMSTLQSRTIERLVDEWKYVSSVGHDWGQVGICCGVCATKVCISQDSFPGFFVLEVVRRLGNLKWAGDPVYRRHCYRRT